LDRPADGRDGAGAEGFGGAEQGAVDVGRDQLGSLHPAIVPDTFGWPRPHPSDCQWLPIPPSSPPPPSTEKLRFTVTFRTVRVGIVILPEDRWWAAEPKWRAAEEYGFDHAWTYDHLGWRNLVDGPWFSAVPTLTAAAMVTSRIRLGTFVASPVARHPVP